MSAENRTEIVSTFLTACIALFVFNISTYHVNTERHIPTQSKRILPYFPFRLFAVPSSFPPFSSDLLFLSISVSASCVFFSSSSIYSLYKLQILTFPVHARATVYYHCCMCGPSVFLCLCIVSNNKRYQFLFFFLRLVWLFRSLWLFARKDILPLCFTLPAFALYIHAYMDIFIRLAFSFLVYTLV